MTFPEYLDLYIQANSDKVKGMQNTYDQDPPTTALNALNSAYDSMMSEAQQMNDGELSFASHNVLLELYYSIYGE